MKIIKPYHEHMEGVTPYQHIEKIGRKCYKSEDKITEDSAVRFVQGLAKSRHYAMLEHWWVHLYYNGSAVHFYNCMSDFARRNCRLFGGATEFTRFMYITNRYGIYLSAPLRVFLEMEESYKRFVNDESGNVNSVICDMLATVALSFPEIMDADTLRDSYTGTFRLMEEKKFCEQLKEAFTKPKHADTSLIPHISGIAPDSEIMKHRTHTALFVCDRGVSHELVRHRPCSFAQESTRYANYSKGKFGSEITVIEPFFYEKKPELYHSWEKLCKFAEEQYLAQIALGATPQEARSVLPNSLKTEIVMTANETEWQHIVDLRAKGTTGTPHPQMKEIMYPWYEELKVLSEGRIQ